MTKRNKPLTSRRILFWQYGGFFPLFAGIMSAVLLVPSRDEFGIGWYLFLAWLTIFTCYNLRDVIQNFRFWRKVNRHPWGILLDANRHKQTRALLHAVCRSARVRCWERRVAGGRAIVLWLWGPDYRKAISGGSHVSTVFRVEREPEASFHHFFETPWLYGNDTQCP